MGAGRSGEQNQVYTWGKSTQSWKARERSKKKKENRTTETILIGAINFSTRQPA